MALSSDTLELLDASVGAGIRDGSAQVVYVIKASPMNLITGVIEDLYFASTTFKTGSGDTPANTNMLGHLVPPNVRVSVIANGRVGSGVSMARGTIRILNPRAQVLDRNDALTYDRGRFDNLRRDYSWAGREIVEYIGPEDGTFSADFEEIFSATVEDFVWNEDYIEIRPTAGVVNLDEDVQKNTYGQSYIVEYNPANDANEIEIDDADESITVFDDLTNVPKPLAYGRVYGIEPQVISKSSEIYQMHTSDKDMEAIDTVYEDGLEMTYPDDYARDLAEGTVTLVGATTGIITVDAQGAKASVLGNYIDTPGEIVYAVINAHCGTARVPDETSFLNYDTEFNYETGYYFGSSHVSRDAFVSEMLQPLGFMYRSRDDQLLVGWVKDPREETPDLTLAERDISSVRRMATMAPAWRVRIGYQPIGRVVDYNDFAGAVTEGETARQSQKYRWVEAIDEGVLARHKGVELSFETRFTARADAQALADRVLAIYNVPRDLIEVKLLHNFMRYDLGDIVRLGYARYDFTDDGDILQENGDKILLEGTGGAYITTDYIDTYFEDATGTDAIIREEHAEGSNFQVVGYVDNPANNEFSVTLWG